MAETCRFAESIVDAIKHTRDLTFELSPFTLDTPGLRAAVEELAEQFAESAEARNVRIVLDRDEQGLRIAVQDDGKGFDVSVLQGCGQGGFGMLSVRERLVRVGGAFDVESEQGKGTKVTMIVPVERGLRFNWGFDGISA